MLKFNFDKKKAISAILYVSKSLQKARISQDLHKIFKILYFADQKHLARYGRPIIGDFYIAMDHGPVPSQIYDIIKTVRGDSIFTSDDNYNEYFSVNKHFMSPKKSPTMDEFSVSDLECIDESIKENKRLSFKVLKDKSHDEAYRKAGKDDRIPFEEMAKIANVDKGTLAYLKSISENQQVFNK